MLDTWIELDGIKPHNLLHRSRLHQFKIRQINAVLFALLALIHAIFGSRKHAMESFKSLIHQLFPSTSAHEMRDLQEKMNLLGEEKDTHLAIVDSVKDLAGDTLTE